MLIGIIIIEQYFILVLNIHNKFFISGYWVFSVFPVIIYFFYLKKKGKLTFKDIGLTFDNMWKSIPLGVLAGLISGFAGWFFLYLIGSPVEPIPREFVIMFLFASVLSAPIREEILVRGILWSFFERVLNITLKLKKKNYDVKKIDLAIIIVVSLIFLFFHTGRSLDVLLTKILFDSFVFSIVYYKTRNLAAPMIAHSISNFFVILRVFVF